MEDCWSINSKSKVNTGSLSGRKRAESLNRYSDLAVEEKVIGKVMGGGDELPATMLLAHANKPTEADKIKGFAPGVNVFKNCTVHFNK